MKIRTYFLILILVSNINLLPQKIINNPDKPTDKNAGRIIKLKEVFNISDKSNESFYFRSPRKVVIDKNRNIYVIRKQVE